MAVLTDFMADIYAALPTFNRELTGFIPAVNVDAQLQGASINDTVKVPLVQVAAPAEYKQQMGVPTPTEVASDYIELKMDKASYVSFPLTGETEAGLRFSGAGTTITQQRFESAFRQLANEMEKYLADKLVAGASRATGTVGTIPFGTAGNLADVANLNKILNDNGAPMADRQLVLNTTALANMQANMSNLFKVNEYGSDAFLRSGFLNTPLQGMNIWASGGLTEHAQGTGSGYKMAADTAKGVKTFSVDTGTGKILAGDVVTIGSDTNKYVINKGADAAGAISIGAPGLEVAASTGDSVTIGAGYTPSVAFQKSAVAFGVRTPYLPSGGDAAIDRTIVQDPVTGIPFVVSVYGGRGMNTVEIAVVYGAGVIQPENVALLIQ
jgi:hypothetical protein